MNLYVAGSHAYLSGSLAAAGGAIQITFLGQAGQTYRVEVSADLKSWSPYTNVLAAESSFDITVPFEGKAPARYYRALMP